jgi:hypothetical protein
MSEAFSNSAICQSASSPEDLPHFIYLLRTTSKPRKEFIARGMQLQNSHIREGMRGRKAAEQPLVLITIEPGLENALVLDNGFAFYQFWSDRLRKWRNLNR